MSIVVNTKALISCTDDLCLCFHMCKKQVSFGFCFLFNNFPVILGQSLDIYQYFGNLKVSCSRTVDILQRSWGSNPEPLAPESEALPLSHCSPRFPHDVAHIKQIFESRDFSAYISGSVYGTGSK